MLGIKDKIAEQLRLVYQQDNLSNKLMQLQLVKMQEVLDNLLIVLQLVI